MFLYKCPFVGNAIVYKVFDDEGWSRFLKMSCHKNNRPLKLRNLSTKCVLNLKKTECGYFFERVIISFLNENSVAPAC